MTASDWTIVPISAPEIAVLGENEPHRELMRMHLTELVRRGVYSADEIAAFNDPNRHCSWIAEPALMAGPLPTIAVLRSGEVVAGIDLWQNLRDQYWFLEALIRNPDRRYRGVGFAVVEAAVAWWIQYASGRHWQLRVHAMTREIEAVAWWTRFAGHPPEYEAFVRSRNYTFPAVGWILNRGTPASMEVRHRAT